VRSSGTMICAQPGIPCVRYVSRQCTEGPHDCNPGVSSNVGRALIGAQAELSQSAPCGSEGFQKFTVRQSSCSGIVPPDVTSRLKRSLRPHSSWTRHTEASSSKLPRSDTTPGNLRRYVSRSGLVGSKEVLDGM